MTDELGLPATAKHGTQPPSRALADFAEMNGSVAHLDTSAFVKLVVVEPDRSLFSGS